MRFVTIAVLLLPAALIAQTRDSCIQCHSSMDGEIQKPALLIKDDIHYANGLSCADCHGGDRTSDDPSVAMSPAKGFVGAPKRTAIPQFCARCHSDPNFMRRFKPQQRVDQFELYKTSVHGQRLAKGDENVATCIDCHSVHDIRAVKNPAAPVYPTHIPDTCGRCHADAQRMAKYGIPTDQLAQYRTSVHWADLKNGDLAAPTCASCHGNHGAKPPEVSSVAAVCGNCHVLFAQNYDKSVHAPIFSGAEGGGGCIVCHSNHGIHPPSTAMLAGPQAVCSKCHEPDTPGGKTAAEMAQWIDGLGAALNHSDAVLTQADQAGMEVSDAQEKLSDGREDLVKARLAMHLFEPEEMHKPIEAGMDVAAETLRAGQEALHEKNVRRIGLAISVFFIAVTVFAIWLLIRRLEVGGSGYIEPSSRNP
ncbi:MAG TPA: cytochrome c3 family protein [Bryobacteraceae bacterium]|nr:cytochrome c3 family protein [Bryobacteraceae bacterium]